MAQVVVLDPARPVEVPRSPAPAAPRPSLGDGRAWWSVAGLTLIVWSLRLYGYVDTYPAISAVSVVLGLWGLGTVGAAWLPRRASVAVRRALAAATLLLAVVGLAIWSFLQVTVAPAYGTDEMAFDQYAARLLAHGANPYVHSMAAAFSMFHVSPDGYTFLLNGHPVTALSYPALSFLVYVPFLLLGWSTQLAVAVNVMAWVLGTVLAFVLLPRPLRPLAIVVGSFSVYVGYAVGGVTDALFVPLLVGAVYQWDRFARTSGWRAWRGPVLLGLAMAVKQTPWLVLPFLVMGIALDAATHHGRWASGVRTGSRYLAIALGTFLVVNLPFIAWSPHAWLTGVLTPITANAVPAGQGLVELSLFLGIGGGSLTAYTLALGIAFLALFATYVAFYPRLRAWAVLLPSVILFFSSRSFGSYLVTLLPAVLVAAFTVAHAPSGDGGWADLLPRLSKRIRRVRTWVVGIGAAATLAAIALVLTSRPPLTVRITSVRTTGQLATVVRVGVSVTNRSSHAVRPTFSVESGGDLTAFWLRDRGPRRLAPGATARYTLLAPNFFAQPPITGGFQVVAFTQHPGTVSQSAAYTPTTWHVSLSPDAVSRVVPLDQPLVVHAQVLDRLDRPVDRSGVPIYLGQVIYDQQGLKFGQAIINGGQVGQTPVVAYTNAEGMATFTIRGTHASLDPVSFEANLVNSGQFYPYGYSSILPVRFGSGP